MHSLPLRPEVLDKHAQLLAEGRVVESDVASAQMALCETQVRVKGDQLFLACPFQGMLGQPLRMDHRQGDTVQIPLESLLQGFVRYDAGNVLLPTCLAKDRCPPWAWAASAHP